MPPYLSTNFKTQKYYQNEPRLNGFYSRDNFPKKVKYRAYVINLYEYADVGTHWIALHVKDNEIIYFDSFGVFLKKSKNLMNIKTQKQAHLEYK